MTGLASRLLIVVTLAAWGGSVFAQTAETAQTAPEDLAAMQAEAESGDPKAQFLLGAYYSEGSGESQDYAKARHWFQKAADQGDATAQYRLVQLYFNGDGGPAVPARGVALMSAASE
ncbi:MAG TPA: sel1 repeat family protein, partial [Vicinamibacteria bacterium]|nr:sel1 repeat family protein [Vicinamibacteria bacterium]